MECEWLQKARKSCSYQIKEIILLNGTVLQTSEGKLAIIMT